MSILILSWIGGIALVAAIIYFGIQAEKKRTAAFQATAAELGFEFSPQGDVDLLKTLGGFHLFSQGHSKKLWNLLRSRTENLELAIFDYTFSVGSGKGRRTSQQSVIAFRFAGPNLSTFLLRPEGFWDKIGSWMGYRDIDFDDYPVFSRSYLLRGNEEKVVRQLFSAPILDYFTDNPGLAVEGGGPILLYYRPRKRVEPQNVRTFMEEGWKVLTLFRPVE
jgi:hypothetical protein